MVDDPLIGQLSKFTPDGANLDRDALLYRAGKASARPDCRWQAMAALLAATQLVTLGFFLVTGAHPSPPAQQQIADSPSNEAISLPRDSKTLASDAADVWVWREHLLSESGSLAPLSFAKTAMPDEPPLSNIDTSHWNMTD